MREVQIVESSESAKVELVRRLYEAFSERDLDAMTALTTPDVEFFPQVTATIVKRAEPYRGHDGLRAYFEDAARVWRELEIIPHDFRDLGDQVLVFGRVYGRGEGGYLSDSPTAWIWRFRDDLVCWGRVFTSRADALEAAGLEA
jgi:ketosteroid isomerase-like protein